MTSKVLSNPTPHSSKTLTVEEVRGRLQNISVEILAEITRDNAHRMDGFTNDIQLLSQGVFYLTDYFKSLKEKNQTNRINHFRDRNVFFHGYTSPNHFTLADQATSPSGKKVANFVLKNGVLPSEALDAMKNGLSLLGCGEVCQIAQYGALQDVLGTEKFNALFASNSPTPLMIGSQLPTNPISRFRLYLMQENPSTLQKGDVVFIQNATTYASKHVTGHAHAFNVLCAENTPGSEKYIGLGLPPEGLTHDQINALLLCEFNLPPDSFERWSAPIRSFFSGVIVKSMEWKDAQLTPESFKELGGGKSLLACALDAERITALANSTLAEARKLLDGYDVKVRSR